MHHIQLILYSALFGSSALLFKIISAHLAVYTTVFLRLAICGLVLCIICLFTKTPIFKKEQFSRILFISSFNFVIPLLLFCYAGNLLDSSITSVLKALFPVFTIILSAVILRERISKIGVIGIAISIAGILCLNIKKDLSFDETQIFPSLILVIATIMYASSAIFVRMKCKDISPLTNITASMTLGSIALLPFLAFETNLQALTQPKILLSVIYISVFATSLAYIISFHLIKVRSATFSASGAFLIPLFGIAFGVIFMHEHMNSNRIIGSALILAGMALALGLYPKKQN
jgi:drug/metabolite transporter (DMT)-like permease